MLLPAATPLHIRCRNTHAGIPTLPVPSVMRRLDVRCLACAGHTIAGVLAAAKPHYPEVDCAGSNKPGESPRKLAIGRYRRAHARITIPFP